MESIDYTVGDNIVCVQSHSKGIVKEGQLLTAKAIRGGTCKCTSILVDIGIPSKNPIGTIYNHCRDCDYTYPDIISDGKWWIDAFLFKKLDTLVEKEFNELMEVLNEPLYK